MRTNLSTVFAFFIALAPVVACTALTGLGGDYTFGGEAGAASDSASGDGSTSNDAAVTADAARLGLTCSAHQSCMSADLSCCGTAGSFTCERTCPVGSFDLHCVSSADCPAADICCATQVGNTEAATCTTLVKCTTQGGGELCDPNASSTRCLRTGGQCNAGAHGLPDSFGICGG